MFARNVAITGDAANGDRAPTVPEQSGKAAARNGNPTKEGSLMAAERPEADQWSRVKDRLRIELGEDVFTSWFTRLELEEAERNVIYLSVPTRFLKSWILSHYRDRLVALWAEERGEPAAIEIVVRGAVRARPQSRTDCEKSTDLPVLPTPPRPAPAAARRPPESDGALGGSPVEPRYAFETFCEGAANRVAYAAARAVAETPSGQPSQFNPLYIHAGVGRGKTHLLHATTQAARRVDPTRKVVYLTAEHFMFRFVAALRSQSAIPFKESLRDIDLLLIDDMQFLQGKSVQQEFCHMLNALIDGARQVVVAADRPPAELESLDERVRSRLKGGVAFEVGAPDLDLRRRILAARYGHASNQHRGLDIPEPVLEYVAQSVVSNGRDLEGALNRLVAQWQFTNHPVTIHSAEITLRDLVGAREPRRVRIEDIQRVVARH
jgi:chromosomal replication initiator protein